MGFLGNTAKKAAKSAGKAAGNKVKHVVNGGCPGSRDGKHKYGSDKMKDVETGKTYAPVTYCKNKGCGRVA